MYILLLVYTDYCLYYLLLVVYIDLWSLLLTRLCYYYLLVVYHILIDCLYYLPEQVSPVQPMLHVEHIQEESGVPCRQPSPQAVDTNTI